MITSAGSSKPYSERITYLDALRGIAASSVAFKHYLLVFGVPPALEVIKTYLPHNFYFDGNPEVSFFFVLSGFVLSYRHYNEQPRPAINLWVTYLSRAARIYPAFFAIFLMSFIAKYFVYQNIAGEEHFRILSYHWPQQLTIENLLKQLTLMPSSSRGMPIVSPDWTLINEVKYSLFLPFLLLVSNRSQIWFVVLSLLLLFNLGEPDYLLFGFALGICIAMAYGSILPKLRTSSFGQKFILLLIVLSIYYAGPLIAIPKAFSSSLAGAGVMCLAFSSRRIQQMLRTRILKYLGKISYSVYLSHFLILLAVAPYWRGWLVQYEWAFFFDVSLFAISVLILSTLLFYIAEQPGIRLGARLKKWLKPDENLVVNKMS